MGVVAETAVNVVAVFEDTAQASFCTWFITSSIEEMPILMPALHSRNNLTESSSIKIPPLRLLFVSVCCKGGNYSKEISKRKSATYLPIIFYINTVI